MITDEMLDDWESLCRADIRVSPTTSLRLITEVRRLRALEHTFRPGREADDSWRVGF